MNIDVNEAQLDNIKSLIKHSANTPYFDEIITYVGMTRNELRSKVLALISRINNDVKIKTMELAKIRSTFYGFLSYEKIAKREAELEACKTCANIASLLAVSLTK